MEQKDKELYYKLMTDCESLIECPNKKAGNRVLACEYCRFEYLRKAIAKEIFNEIFESVVFSFKGNDDYKKGFCDALEQYDKQLRDLAKLKGVEVEE